MRANIIAFTVSKMGGGERGITANIMAFKASTLGGGESEEYMSVKFLFVV